MSFHLWIFTYTIEICPREVILFMTIRRKHKITSMRKDAPFESSKLPSPLSFDL